MTFGIARLSQLRLATDPAAPWIMTMYRRTAQIADIWIGRHSLDTAARRTARSAVAGLRPAVIVTGGSSGIGLELARVFLATGHTVVLVARNQTNLAIAAQSLDSSGRENVFTIAADITNPDCPKIIGDKLNSLGCYLNILINNAAAGLSGPFDEHTQPEIEGLIATNVSALTRLTRHALPGLLARGQGGIVNIASLGAYVPGPYQAAYYASKAYVVSLTEAIASEIAGQGVRVCVVAPGPVNTGFHAAMRAERAPYRQYLPALSPARIAQISYRGFTIGRRVIVPSVFNHLMFAALKLMPHVISVPITKWLLKNPKQ